MFSIPVVPNPDSGARRPRRPEKSLALQCHTRHTTTNELIVRTSNVLNSHKQAKSSCADRAGAINTISGLGNVLRSTLACSALVAVAVHAPLSQYTCGWACASSEVTYGKFPSTFVLYPAPTLLHKPRDVNDEIKVKGLNPHWLLSGCNHPW